MLKLKNFLGSPAQALEDELTEAQRKVEAARNAIEVAKNDRTKSLAGAREDLRVAEAEIDRIKRDIESRDRLIQRQQEFDNADAILKAARKESQAASKALAALDIDFSKASAKLAKLQGEVEGELAQARSSEKDAAEAYAAALASSDEAAESEALNRLNQASEALESVERKASRQSAIVAALTAQVDGIEQKRLVERDRLEASRGQLLRGIRHKVAAEWDKQAGQMAELAAQLVALERAIGASGKVMDDLSIPLLTPGGASEIRGSKVRDASYDVDVDSIRI